MREVPVVGVVVLCAKPDELTVIKQQFDQKFPKSTALGQSYFCYELPPKKEMAPQIMVLAHCVQMGNMYSASITSFLIGTLKPNLVIFIGTAGSLSPAKCAVGDVVVPDGGCVTKYFDKISDHKNTGLITAFFDKISWRKQHPTPAGPIDLVPMTRDGKKYVFARRFGREGLTTASRAFVMDMRSGAAPTLERYTKIEDNRAPKIHYDTVMFSWDIVVDSAHYRDLLKAELDRKVLAVDTESFGFLSAINQFQQKPYDSPVSGIIIRGISDICGDKSTSDDDGRNDLAVRNASVVASELILRAY